MSVASLQLCNLFNIHLCTATRTFFLVSLQKHDRHGPGPAPNYYLSLHNHLQTSFLKKKCSLHSLQLSAFWPPPPWRNRYHRRSESVNRGPRIPKTERHARSGWEQANAKTGYVSWTPWLHYNPRVPPNAGLDQQSRMAFSTGYILGLAAKLTSGSAVGVERVSSRGNNRAAFCGGSDLICLFNLVFWICRLLELLQMLGQGLDRWQHCSLHFTWRSNSKISTQTRHGFQTKKKKPSRQNCPHNKRPPSTQSSC